MNKKLMFIQLFIILFLCSCSSKMIKVEDNIIRLEQNDDILQELNFNHFEILGSQEFKNGILIEYKYITDTKAVGYPKYSPYEGEIYFLIQNDTLKPVLNIVHKFNQSFGARINLLNKTETDNYLDVEYEVQLYEIQKAAGFGTVKIRYEYKKNELNVFEYKIIDYKSEINSYLRKSEDSDVLYPSMEGDIVRPVEFPVEEFNKIIDQVYEYIS